MGNDEGTRAVLLFHAGARGYAIPLEHVVETMRPLPIEPIAGAPPAVLGLAILRGSPVPVLDVSALLEDGAPATSPPSAAPPSRFITLRLSGRQVALAVHAVIGIRTLAPPSVHPLPPLLRDADAHAVTAIGTLDHELLVILRTARLLSDEILVAPAAPRGAP